MREKLTLHVERELLEKARERAESRGLSVSDLLADYLATFIRESEGERESPSSSKASDGENFGPITRSLGARPERTVTEADYHRHLEKKHS